MKTTSAIKYCMLLAPAMVLSAGYSFAQESAAGPGSSPGLTQEQPLSADDAMHPSAEPRAEEQRTGPRSAEDIRASGDRSHDRNPEHASYLTGTPANAMNAEDLIGSEVKSLSDDSDLGTVKDLVIDINGNVIAVVVGVGGFLGIRERDVAIPWRSLAPARSDDGQDYIFHVNETESSLESAPDYKQN